MKRVAILLSILIALAPFGSTEARTMPSSEEDGINRGADGPSAQAAGANEQPKQLSLKIAEGERIILRNRFGPIIVTGIGGDTLEANVSLLRQGTTEYKFRVATTRQGKERIMVSTAVTAPGDAMGERYRENKGTGTGRASGSVVTEQKSPKPPRPAPSPGVKPGTPQPRTQGTATTVRPVRPARQELTETSPPEYLRGVRDIKLEVKLPRDARIELIDSRRYALMNSGTPAYLTSTRNDVFVTNINTPVSIVSSGEVQAAKVAAIEVKTRAGNVQVKEIAGPVSISTVMGAIVVRDTGGDVRAVSISGPINVECARGRTEATTTNGIITLIGIGGDLDASTTGGTISFTGQIRGGGRYRLKSMSGQVRMLIQREPPGFMATLSSYKGQILLDFELKTELSANTATSDMTATQGQPARRVSGRYGDGDARITLDSFSGTVQLGRASSEVWKRCQ